MEVVEAEGVVGGIWKGEEEEAVEVISTYCHLKDYKVK
jgi:hypothetical protein